MTLARIYSPARNAMQSGKAKVGKWILEFEPTAAKTPDNLMGWSGSDDMHSQIKLKFATQEDAEAYAKREHIEYVVVPPKQPKTIIKSYASNFK